MSEKTLKLALATTSRHKVEEVAAILAALGVNNLAIAALPNLPEVDETGDTFAQNALLKAQSLLPQAQVLLAQGFTHILADDSGYCVEALAGSYGLNEFPGVQSNRWLTPERRAEILGLPPSEPLTQEQKNTAILKLLQGKSSRKACYVCALACIEIKTQNLIEVEGQMMLKVTLQASGHHGFGYDPINHPILNERVQPQTVAQWLPTLKNQHSHRASALRQLHQAFSSTN